MALKIELEVQEINTILAVLGKHPFEEVVSLIGKIKQQGEPQAEEQAKAAEAAAAQAAQPAAEAPAAGFWEAPESCIKLASCC